MEKLYVYKFLHVDLWIGVLHRFDSISVIERLSWQVSLNLYYFMNLQFWNTFIDMSIAIENKSQFIANLLTIERIENCILFKLYSI